MIATHLYEHGDKPLPEWYQDENGNWKENGEGENWYNDSLARFNICNEKGNNYTPFDCNLAQQDMEKSNEKGLVYYVAVVHFADGSSAVSETYPYYGF